jgi:NitT/TauT family transport system substrate-binding protein
MNVSRRDAMKVLSAGCVASVLGADWLVAAGARPAAAQAGRVLGINLLGFSLGIHVPSIAAALDMLPAMRGYAPPKIARLDQIRTLTQTLIAGAAEIGETDPMTVFRAVESGADLKIIGNVYLNTSLVFVANGDKVRELKDLEKPGVTVAVNGKGDTTYTLLVGPLLKRGVDLKKLTVIEIGGSGARMQALLAKRVDAVPMHFDQAAQVGKQGNFRVLLEPWKEYRVWLNEVWAVNGAWIRKPENQRAAVDLMKAVMIASRRANHDLPWYVEEYRKHVTLPNANQATAEELRPLWRKLADEVKAWPSTNALRVEDFRELLPVYKAAEAITGTVKVEQVVDTSYAEQALKEVGR